MEVKVFEEVARILAEIFEVAVRISATADIKVCKEFMFHDRQNQLFLVKQPQVY